MLYRTDIVGLSTEEKPIKGLENGATFYCVDTGDLYIFYKGTWYLQEFVEPNNESKGISLISNNKKIEEPKEIEEIVEDTRESEIEENEELSIDEK